MEVLNRIRRIRRARDPVGLQTNRLPDKINPIEFYSEKEFRARFRFSKAIVAEYLLPLLSKDLTCFHGQQLPVTLQLLVSLRFFATGSFQKVTGDTVNISQPSVCRIVQKISSLFASLRPQFIKFPTAIEASKVRSDFFKLSNFPGITGAIDCTHIEIKSPGGDDAEVYRNRKGYFSINVQAVCSSDLTFTNCVTRWKGSTHDSRIFENSRLYTMLESGEYPSHLIGDSGYPLSRFLLIPYEKATTPAQKRYNHSLRVSRCTVERAFGILKRRFACLGMALRTKLSTSLRIIIACMVLHNISIICNDIWEDDEIEATDDSSGENCVILRNNPIAEAHRNRITQNYFSN